MMTLLDTSVLIAATVEAHPHHGPSHHFIERARETKGRVFLSTHGLAEFFSALTAMPIDPPVGPLEAREVIEERILKSFELVDLSGVDYRKALDRVCSRNLKSGAIFDALHVQAAIKMKVPRLVTWNPKHFLRLVTDELRIVTPDEL